MANSEETKTKSGRFSFVEKVQNGGRVVLGANQGSDAGDCHELLYGKGPKKEATATPANVEEQRVSSLGLLLNDLEDASQKIDEEIQVLQNDRRSSEVRSLDSEQRQSVALKRNMDLARKLLAERADHMERLQSTTLCNYPTGSTYQVGDDHEENNGVLEDGPRTSISGAGSRPSRTSSRRTTMTRRGSSRPSSMILPPSGVSLVFDADRRDMASVRSSTASVDDDDTHDPVDDPVSQEQDAELRQLHLETLGRRARRSQETRGSKMSQSDGEGQTSMIKMGRNVDSMLQEVYQSLELSDLFDAYTDRQLKGMVEELKDEVRELDRLSRGDVNRRQEVFESKRMLEAANRALKDRLQRLKAMEDSLAEHRKRVSEFFVVPQGGAGPGGKGSSSEYYRTGGGGGGVDQRTSAEMNLGIRLSEFANNTPVVEMLGMVSEASSSGCSSDDAFASPVQKQKHAKSFMTRNADDGGNNSTSEMQKRTSSTNIATARNVAPSPTNGANASPKNQRKTSNRLSARSSVSSSDYFGDGDDGEGRKSFDRLEDDDEEDAFAFPVNRRKSSKSYRGMSTKFSDYRDTDGSTCRDTTPGRDTNVLGGGMNNKSQVLLGAGNKSQVLAAGTPSTFMSNLLGWVRPSSNVEYTIRDSASQFENSAMENRNIGQKKNQNDTFASISNRDSNRDSRTSISSFEFDGNDLKDKDNTVRQAGSSIYDGDDDSRSTRRSLGTSSVYSRTSSVVSRISSVFSPYRVRYSSAGDYMEYNLPKVIRRLWMLVKIYIVVGLLVHTWTNYRHRTLVRRRTKERKRAVARKLDKRVHDPRRHTHVKVEDVVDGDGASSLFSGTASDPTTTSRKQSKEVHSRARIKEIVEIDMREQYEHDHEGDANAFALVLYPDGAAAALHDLEHSFYDAFHATVPLSSADVIHAVVPYEHQGAAHAAAYHSKSYTRRMLRDSISRVADAVNSGIVESVRDFFSGIGESLFGFGPKKDQKERKEKEASKTLRIPAVPTPPVSQTKKVVTSVDDSSTERASPTDSSFAGPLLLNEGNLPIAMTAPSGMLPDHVQRQKVHNAMREQLLDPAPIVTKARNVIKAKKHISGYRPGSIFDDLPFMTRDTRPIVDVHAIREYGGDAYFRIYGPPLFEAIWALLLEVTKNDKTNKSGEMSMDLVAKGTSLGNALVVQEKKRPAFSSLGELSQDHDKPDFVLRDSAMTAFEGWTDNARFGEGSSHSTGASFSGSAPSSAYQQFSGEDNIKFGPAPAGTVVFQDTDAGTEVGVPVMEVFGPFLRRFQDYMGFVEHIQKTGHAELLFSAGLYNDHTLERPLQYKNGEPDIFPAYADHQGEPLPGQMEPERMMTLSAARFWRKLLEEQILKHVQRSMLALASADYYVGGMVDQHSAVHLEDHALTTLDHPLVSGSARNLQVHAKLHTAHHSSLLVKHMILGSEEYNSRTLSAALRRSTSTSSGSSSSTSSHSAIPDYVFGDHEGRLQDHPICEAEFLPRLQHQHAGHQCIWYSDSAFLWFPAPHPILLR
ncbi:unnamed protein product [Amoebophrya sp. A25]|nr:unnamed protein product [Amoebophrya sp. A25]|eukprot:GSA25T00003204001.1